MKNMKDFLDMIISWFTQIFGILDNIKLDFGFTEASLLVIIGALLIVGFVITLYWRGGKT